MRILVPKIGTCYCLSNPGFAAARMKTAIGDKIMCIVLKYKNNTLTLTFQDNDDYGCEYLVELEKNLNGVKFLSLPREECRRIHADASQSEIEEMMKAAYDKEENPPTERRYDDEFIS